MSTAATAEHTCHGAIFCGQPRAAAERECPACQAPRPLLEVLEEHCAQVRAQREPHPAVARLAQMIADSGDFAAVLELRPILQGAAFNALCIELDICDVHLTDQDTCRDDRRSCPAGRADA